MYARKSGKSRIFVHTNQPPPPCLDTSLSLSAARRMPPMSLEDGPSFRVTPSGLTRPTLAEECSEPPFSGEGKRPGVRRRYRSACSAREKPPAAHEKTRKACAVPGLAFFPSLAGERIISRCWRPCRYRQFPTSGRWRLRHPQQRRQRLESGRRFPLSDRCHRQPSR